MTPREIDTLAVEDDARLAQIEADYLSDEPRFPEFDDPCWCDPWEAASWS